MALWTWLLAIYWVVFFITQRSLLTKKTHKSYITFVFSHQSKKRRGTFSSVQLTMTMQIFRPAANCCYLLKKKFNKTKTPLSAVDCPSVNHPSRPTLAVSLHTGAGLLLPPLPAALCQSCLKLSEAIKCAAESERLLIQRPCTSCTFLPITAQSALDPGEF